LKLNKTKNDFLRYVQNPILFFIFYFILICSRSNLLFAEESYLKEIEIDTSTKFEEESSALPTNPFELVEMIRRANSLNDATNPSEAIDDALESFNMIETKGDL
tara:strand:- start:112 stop:423 length:312 start_codon:yes stop_codon:yes gene_type:complete